MEQETTGTQGSSQGGGLVPDVLGQVGAGAIPGVLPVQRGSDGVSDRPTPETDALKEYLATRRSFVLCDSAMWTDHASRLERQRDEAREALFAEKERLCADLATKDARLVQLRAEVERLRGELQMAATSLPLDSPAYQRAAEALAGKEGAPSQRLDLGDNLIHERDIARLWATELANALDGMGYPDRIQMEAFRQVEQSWKEGV